MDALLTVREVAAALSCSTATVRRRIAEGQLPALQLGGRGTGVRVAARELDRWLTSEPPEEPAA